MINCLFIPFYALAWIYGWPVPTPLTTWLTRPPDRVCVQTSFDDVDFVAPTSISNHDRGLEILKEENRVPPVYGCAPYIISFNLFDQSKTVLTINLYISKYN
jgi:hypothetical protein